ncbi:MAG: M28 family peptidase [Bacteroidales bacterium]
MIVQKNTSFFQGLVVTLAMLAIVYFSFRSSQPPDALPSDAPAEEFSATRATEHLTFIASEKHPTGSPAIKRVRDYLVEELRALGQDPQLQSIEFFDPESQRAAMVGNVMVRVRGSGEGDAVLFMGHYDSREESFGAADNGSAVITMLELIRMLNHHPPLKNDLIFLFTDGEEYGLFGAKAFVNEHPWARDVNLVVNIESRGTTGSSMLFETSGGNLEVISGFSRSVSHPIGNSMAYEIYTRMPNYTDFGPFKDRGYQGLNLAYLENGFDYHTTGDRIEHLDLRSVQHHGTYAVGLALHFGDSDLDFNSGKNAVFFNTFGYGFAWYSYGWAIPLAIFALVFFVVLLVAGISGNVLRPLNILFGFLAFALYLLILFVIASSLYMIISGFYPGADHRLLEFKLPDLVVGFAGVVLAFSFAFYHFALKGLRLWNALALLALVLVLLAWSGQLGLMNAFYALLGTAALYIILRKPSPVWGLAAGAMILWTLLAVLTAFIAPGVSYLFVWPLIFALMGITVFFIIQPGKEITWLRALILLGFALPVLAWFPQTAYLFTVAMGLGMLGYAFLLVGLMVGLLLPHIELTARSYAWVMPALFLVVGLLFLLKGAAWLDYDQRHQKLSTLHYVTNGHSGETMWVTMDEQADEWTGQFLSDSPDAIDRSAIIPGSTGNYLGKITDLPALPLPVARVLSDSIYDGQRVLTLHVHSERGAGWMYMYFNAGPSPVMVGINDAEPELLRSYGESPWHYLPYFAFPEEGVVIGIHVNPQQSVELHLLDIIHGLPEFIDKEPRPPHMMAHGDRSMAAMRFSF